MRCSDVSVSLGSGRYMDVGAELKNKLKEIMMIVMLEVEIKVIKVVL